MSKELAGLTNRHVLAYKCYTAQWWLEKVRLFQAMRRHERVVGGHVGGREGAFWGRHSAECREDQDQLGVGLVV